LHGIRAPRWRSVNLPVPYRGSTPKWRGTLYPPMASIHLQEGFGIDASLLEYGAQRGLGHIAGVIGDGGVAVSERD
jgi:hypothetical protein